MAGCGEWRECGEFCIVGETGVCITETDLCGIFTKYLKGILACSN